MSEAGQKKSDRRIRVPRDAVTSATTLKPDSDTGDTSNKVITVPRDIDIVEYRTASELKMLLSGIKQWKFENSHDETLYWHPASQTADEFCSNSGIMGSSQVLFRNPQIKMFIPVQTHYYATRIVRLRGQATVKSILRAIYEFARKAYAYYIVNELGQKPYVHSVMSLMHGMYVARLLCRRVGGSNHVYVEA